MRLRHVGLALFVASLAVSACSLALNWSQDGLPCEYTSDGKYSCLQGYTCALRNLNDPNDNLCIKNGSLPLNANCQKDIQCEQGLTCPSGICWPKCDPNQSYFGKGGSACDLGQYCKPFYTTSCYTGKDTPTVCLEGACVDSDGCTKGQVCDPEGGTAGSGMCLAVDNDTTACVLSCDVYFQVPTLSSSYQEYCSKRGEYNSSCQAVGPSGNQVTACVADFPAAVPEGTACNNPVSQPCDQGQTCWAGQCATWCPLTTSPSSVCASGQYCCDTGLTSSQSTRLGYCVTGTSANCTAP